MRRPRQEGFSSIGPEAEAKRAAPGSLRKSTRGALSNIAGGRKIRCAIYTRKSSEEGLEQEFNSLEHEGWNILPKLYDDPGYSGGTIERPALKRLLADIAAHRIDAVVVYSARRGENASATSLGKEARIRPTASQLRMLYQILNSWRSEMDSNQRYLWPYCLGGSQGRRYGAQA